MALALWLAACSPASVTPAPATGIPASPVPASAMPATTVASARVPDIATATVMVATATALPVPSATPLAASATPPGETLFHFTTDNPIVKANIGWARSYIDPGATIFYKGQFHMFFNGITAWPSPVGVGYATSTDGIHWTPQGTQPVFSLGPVTQTGSYDGPNLFATSVLVQPDGTWVLYYYNLQGSAFTGEESIGRATAQGPAGPWTADPQPLLTHGPAGAWDEVQVSAPDVIQVSGGYVMYYDGMNLDRISRIGMATSSDGQHWNKYNDPATTAEPYAESDPVLEPQPNSWDSKRVMDANVLPIDGGWAMIYLTNDGSSKFSGSLTALGYATSKDGRVWTRSPANPILSNKYHPSWGASYLVTLAQDAANQYLYFDVAGGSGTSIYLATHSGPLTQLPSPQPFRQRP